MICQQSLVTLGAHSTIDKIVLSKLKGSEQPTVAMESGLAEEEPAAKAYKAHLQQIMGPDCRFQLETLGALVHRQQPYIAASPDRKVSIQKGGIETVCYVHIKGPSSRLPNLIKGTATAHEAAGPD